MKRLLIAICVVVAVATFASCKDSYAGVMWLAGSVTDSETGEPVPGAKLYFNMNPGSLTIYTTPGGIYWKCFKNFCNKRYVMVSANGYYTQFKTITDGSCWGCCVTCPPEYAEWGCNDTLVNNFKMVKRQEVSVESAPLAVKPELVQITSDNTGILIGLMSLFTIDFCVFKGNACNYDCLYQFVADVANGREVAFGHDIYPEPRELPDCPEVTSFVDFVNEWMDNMFEFYYGNGQE